VNIAKIDNFNDFLALEKVWNQVLEKSPSDTVFLTHEWFRCWWQAYGNGNNLFILLVEDEGEIIAVAPLMISKERCRGFPVKKVGFIENNNSPQSNFIILAKDKECLSLIVDYLRGNNNLWDIVLFNNIPKESRTTDILPEILAEKRLLSGIRNGTSSPYITINSDWQNYYSKRSKKFREVLNNKANRLKKLGTITIREFNNCDQDDGLMTEVFEIGRRSWKVEKKIAISSTKENRKFFSELSKIASRKGWLSIWLLYINDCPVAFEYHLRYKGKVYALRAAYVEEYREVSPGSVLDKHIVEHLFKSGFTEYDLGPGVVFYKMRWTSEINLSVQIILFKNGLLAYLIYLIEFRIIGFLKKLAFYQEIKLRIISLSKHLRRGTVSRKR